MCAFAVAQAVLEDAVVAIWLQEESFVGLCESGTSIVGLTATDVLTCGLDAFKGSDYSQKLSAFAERVFRFCANMSSDDWDTL